MKTLTHHLSTLALLGLWLQFLPLKLEATPPPVVTSFSPTSAVAGTLLTVQGSNLTGVIAVTVGGVNAQFLEFTSSTLAVFVPENGVSGPIAILTAGGQAVSPESFTFINPDAPGITDFTPLQGAAGSSVQINGTNLTTVTSVKFNGTTAGFSLIGGALFATVPASATTGLITVTTPEGVAVSPVAFTVLTSANAPVITSFTPATGQAGSTSVTISGSNLAGATSVRFNGTTAVFFGFGNSLFATVPAGATTGLITVTTPKGTATSATLFTVVGQGAPTITGFTPTHGQVGSTVQITGNNFVNVTAVRFAGQNATAFNLLGNSILVTVPAVAQTGPLTVVTPSGSATSLDIFVVDQATAPAVTSFFPTSGEPGTSIEIRGMNLTTASEVKFNGTAAASFNVLGGSVFATVPAAATTGPIMVTTANGTATSADSFTVLEPSTGGTTITSFSPSSGPAGTNVEINGTAFGNVTSVLFGGVAASFTNLSSLRISATVPDLAPTGLITLITPTSTNLSSTLFTVTEVVVQDPPTLTSFSPTNGVPGSLVEITGSNLTNVLSVAFNGTSASFTNGTAELLMAFVPTNAVDGPISITTAGGTVISGEAFDILHPPSIVNLNPSSGSIGALVEITGSNFVEVAEVRFGGIAAAFTNVTSQLIATIVPANALSGPVRVMNALGVGVSAESFTVLHPPAITGFSPPSGLSGTLVEIAGSNFVDVVEVRIGAIAAAFTTDSSQLITAIVPANAISGPIRVMNTLGVAESAVFYEVLFPPAISGFSPGSGLPGTEVVINGSSFTGVSEVLFGGVAAVFTNVSSQLITAVVPVNAPSGPIRVMNTLGASVSAESFDVLRPPALVSFSPGNGLPGAPIEITGSNFVAITEVRFNGTLARFNPVSTALLVAVVPTNALSGPITVANLVGTAVSSSAFTIEIPVDPIGPPGITGFTPASGLVGASVRLTGSNLVEVSEVRFNGVVATFTTVSATEINATVPVGATTGPVTITTPKGTTTSAIAFEVLPLPAPPRMTLLRVSDSAVAISWNSERAGFVLQSSVTLAPPAGWQDVVAAPLRGGGTTTVLVTLSSGPLFYRVVFPVPGTP